MTGASILFLQLILSLGWTTGQNQTSDSTRQACESVDVMILYQKASQYGGMMADQSTTEEACQTLCLESRDCTAVDFHTWESSCWLHVTSDITSHGNSSCCNHYKKQQVCQHSCFDIYKDQQLISTDISFEALLDGNATYCRDSCVTRDGCHGFLYVSSSQQCRVFHNVSILRGNETQQSPQHHNFTGDRNSDTWIKQKCLGHKNDTIIESVSTTTTLRYDKESSSRTPMVIDVAPPVEHDDDHITDGGLSVPMVLLIVGGAVISTIGVVSVVVFMYQKRRQAANNKQIPNPSSPQHWIKQCNPSAITTLQNLSKCDQCQGSGLARGSRYHDDLLIPMDTFPMNHARQAALMSMRPPRADILAGLPDSGTSQMFSKTLPRPRVYCPTSMDYCDACTQPGSTRDDAEMVHHSNLPTSHSTHQTSHLGTLHSASQGWTDYRTTELQRTPSKRLTRYKVTTWARDARAYLAEFGKSDQYYKGFSD